MTIEHLAIWCKNLEAMKDFYTELFGGQTSARYTNPKTGFSSYFVRFPAGGARLELMQMPGLAPNQNPVASQCYGLAHFAVAVGSEAAVWAMTERLQAHQCPILRGPRLTGDGYFEVEALDIEGNRLEIMK
jgi:lactoylglutathione lyase